MSQLATPMQFTEEELLMNLQVTQPHVLRLESPNDDKHIRDIIKKEYRDKFEQQNSNEADTEFECFLFSLDRSFLAVKLSTCKLEMLSEFKSDHDMNDEKKEGKIETEPKVYELFRKEGITDRL